MFKKLAIYLMVPVFSLSMIFNQSAYAEWYLGGAVGVTIPHTIDDLESTGSGFTITSSGLDPDTAFVGCQGQSKFVPVWRSKSVPLGLKNIGY